MIVAPLRRYAPIRDCPFLLRQEMDVALGVDVAACQNGDAGTAWELVAVEEEPGQRDRARWLEDQLELASRNGHGTDDLVLADQDDAVEVAPQVIERDLGGCLAAQTVGDGAADLCCRPRRSLPGRNRL